LLPPKTPRALRAGEVRLADWSKWEVLTRPLLFIRAEDDPGQAGGELDVLL
jgi:hypothetical protein